MKLSKIKTAVIFILFSFGFLTCFADNSGSDTEVFTFVQLCDPQLGFGQSYEKDMESFRLAVGRINNLNPDFVLVCGDMVQTFDDKSISDFNDIKAELKVPCYCCPGNHDIGNEPNESSLAKYREFFGKDYFSFEHKSVTFVMTNTSLWKVTLEGESEKHDSWFRQTLAAAAEKQSPVFVFGHYPLYEREPNEPDGYNPLPLAIRKDLLDLMENSGVVAYLSGHTHRRIINDYNSIQLVTGETTSRNMDGRPFGFFIWEVSPDSKPQWWFMELES